MSLVYLSRVTKGVSERHTFRGRMCRVEVYRSGDGRRRNSSVLRDNPPKYSTGDLT